ncbi:MAG TPA: FkbM family methyltransferase [Lacibacter sp.]|nr:FkbM family methyltransferase [Lacibacter sp.]
MKYLKLLLPAKFKRNIKDQLGVPSLHWTLQNLKRIGFQPRFILDIGAYQGYWTKEFLEVFPAANILMVEGQTSKSQILQTICNTHSNVSYRIAILSAQDGQKVLFHANETASHAAYMQEAESNAGAASITLDTLVGQEKFPNPDFIKIDVQGFELEVLKGAAAVLQSVEFVLLEVSLLSLGGEPLLTDVVQFMDQKGFQPYDICQFMRRPYDQALYQIDLLFIRKSSPLIASNRWR